MVISLALYEAGIFPHFSRGVSVRDGFADAVFSSVTVDLSEFIVIHFVLFPFEKRLFLPVPHRPLLGLLHWHLFVLAWSQSVICRYTSTTESFRPHVHGV
jgi:hypothetical protein